MHAVRCTPPPKAVKVCAGFSKDFAAFRLGVSLNHMFKELVLPPDQLLLVAHDLRGTQSFILRQRDKTKVHMGIFLVQMHHGGQDGFRGLALTNELHGFAEEFFWIEVLHTFESA